MVFAKLTRALCQVGGYLDRGVVRAIEWPSSRITRLCQKVSGLGPLPNDVVRLRIDHSDVAVRILEESSADSGGVRREVRTGKCTWKMTMYLLMAEFIGAAILGFPRAFATTGIWIGISMVVFIGVTYCYTCHILWQFCLRHEGVRDICDIGRLIVPGCSQFGYCFTCVMFVAHNIVCTLSSLVWEDPLSTSVMLTALKSCSRSWGFMSSLSATRWK